MAVDGDIHEDGTDTKISCTRIKLVKKLSVEEFVAHSLMYMINHPHLKTNNVKMDSAIGQSLTGFWIVRGKKPICKAPIGTIVGMAQEAPDSKDITLVTVYKVDGKKYSPDYAYFADGSVARREWNEA